MPVPTKKWLVLALLAGGCSVRSIATGALADTFAGSGSAYGSDEDPELIQAAVPFALKTMEQVLADQPKHVGLITALSSGFTQYSYAFVQQEADVLEEKDVEKSRGVQLRAKKLFLRARNYGLMGLEVSHPGFRAAVAVETQRKTALSGCKKEDVPLLYWTAASWALAVSDGKNDMKLVSELPIVEQMMARALELDESWNEGSIHEFYVAYDAGRSEQQGGGAASAKKHLERARALAGNKRLGPIVSYAEGVCVAAQDKKEFTRLLEEVVAADVDKHPTDRLANVIAQRRARWLLSRTNDLFAE